MTPVSRTSLARAAAALVALLLVLGDLLGFAHQAAEAHAVCAEHGELVHAEASVALRELEREAEVSGDPGRGAPEHGVADHCRACAAAHDPMTVAVADTSAVAAIEVAWREPGAPIAAEPRDRAVLATAPKTSPPTV